MNVRVISCKCYRDTDGASSMELLPKSHKKGSKVAFSMYIISPASFREHHTHSFPFQSCTWCSTLLWTSWHPTPRRRRPTPAVTHSHMSALRSKCPKCMWQAGQNIGRKTNAMYHIIIIIRGLYGTQINKSIFAQARQYGHPGWPRLDASLPTVTQVQHSQSLWPLFTLLSFWTNNTSLFGQKPSGFSAFLDLCFSQV